MANTKWSKTQAHRSAALATSEGTGDEITVALSLPTAPKRTYRLVKRSTPTTSTSGPEEPLHRSCTLLTNALRIAAIDTPPQAMPRLHGSSRDPRMAYEPGTTDCRVLIDSKAQIEAMLLSLAKLEHTEHIRQQLLAVHNQLEGLHELQRQRRGAGALTAA